MCHGCWDERLEANTAPTPVTGEIKGAVAWLHVLYQHHGAGGALHVYVDDWNLPVPADLPDYLTDLRVPLDAVEQRCWDAMSVLSEDQQATALAIFDGYYRPAPDVSPLTMRMGFWGAEKFWSDEVEALFYSAKCGICGEYKTFQQDPKIFDRGSCSCSRCLSAGKRPFAQWS